MKNYDQLIDSALAELESCENLDLLEKARVKFFGKNGQFRRRFQTCLATFDYILEHYKHLFTRR